MDRLTVRDIVKLGGGAKALSLRSSDLAARGELAEPVADKTIYSWFGSGIPEKHWRWLRPVCGVTVEQLHDANEAARRSGSVA